MIVMATMVPHNFIQEHGGDEDFALFDHNPNFIPTIQERYNKYVVPSSASDGSTYARNPPTMDSFLGDCSFFCLEVVDKIYYSHFACELGMQICHVNLDLACELIQ
jgi:hypothetical protein